ncbi:MAG: twin transmembrane helix small protein [Halofilum sp. (in: g-proteobacteria)]|nr:twin transmembrane helix small protein [Halofilum sp. (in: g-proteobacteria)]
MNIFFILAFAALVATAVILARGVRSMTHGGEEDEAASTHLMFRRVEFQAAAFALILVAIFLAGGWLQAPQPHGDRLAIHLGVIPAEVVRDQYGADSDEANAYASLPDSEDAHLVTVAVQERATGRRVDNAEVSATVGMPGMTRSEKPLNAASFDGMTTYGNYFRMPDSGIYQIGVTVERPGVEGTDFVQLEYHRP